LNRPAPSVKLSVIITFNITATACCADNEPFAELFGAVSNANRPGEVVFDGVRTRRHSEIHSGTAHRRHIFRAQHTGRSSVSTILHSVCLSCYERYLRTFLIILIVIHVRHQHDGDVYHRTARFGNVRREFRDGFENGLESSTSLTTRSGRQILLGRFAVEP